MLVSLKELLQAAEQGEYAVIAPEFANILMAQTLIELAEDLHAPLLLSHSPQLKPACDLPDYRRFIEIIREIAASASIPVGLHLDHATRIEDIEEVIAIGFTSVMIDASTEPWDVNVARTKQVVELAHAVGVDVEAELGHVAIGSKYPSGTEEQDNKNVFTDPDRAVEFVSLTGVDALAVSIGTLHGEYTGKPNLKFDLLEQLYNTVPVPLVLHGASYTGETNLRRAVTLGIRKINVFSDILRAAQEEIAAICEPACAPLEIANAQRRGVRRAVEFYIQVSGSVESYTNTRLDIPDLADHYFRNGYGCAQSIFRAFAETEGYPSDAVEKTASTQIAGMADQGLTCGALLGGLMVIGARESHAMPGNKTKRHHARALSAELIQWYHQQRDSTLCRDILELDFTVPEEAEQFGPGGYFDRICAPLLRETCDWLIEHFSEYDRGARTYARQPGPTPREGQ